MAGRSLASQSRSVTCRFGQGDQRRPRVTTNVSSSKEDPRRGRTVDWRDLLADAKEHEKGHLEKMVADGDAQSTEEARRKLEEDAMRTYAELQRRAKVVMTVGEKARAQVVEMARIRQSSLDNVQILRERLEEGLAPQRSRVALPLPDIKPMPVVIHEAVGELIRNTDSRMDSLEDAVHSVRKEQEEQGKRSRQLRKTLWGWGIAVTVLLSFLSFLTGLLLAD